MGPIEALREGGRARAVARIAASRAPAWSTPRRPMLAAGLVALALAALSLLLPSTVGYDPWAWLIWGREVAALDLDTIAGPAWKPLPVMVTTLLAPLGDAAPEAWLVLARASGLVALMAAAALAARLAAPGVRLVAGAAAALALAGASGFARGVALGFSEGLLVALVLLAAERHLAGRRRTALALAVAAALLRVEAWPLVALYALWLARGSGRRWAIPAVAGGSVAVAALWLLPDVWGSGDLLRSGERARIPNPGAPALADHPWLATLEGFGSMVGWPVLAVALVGLALARRRPAPVALAVIAVAWAAIVAAMSELGYSGEDRYLAPAAALVAVLAGLALALLVGRLRPRLGGLATALGLAAPIAAAVVVLVPAGRALGSDLDHDARLHADLPVAIARAGGAARLRACGSLAVGRYRFPVAAWHLGVPIARMGMEPRLPGVVLRSRLRPGDPLEPPAPAGLERLGAAGDWEVQGACPRRPPASGGLRTRRSSLSSVAPRALLMALPASSRSAVLAGLTP